MSANNIVEQLHKDSAKIFVYGTLLNRHTRGGIITKETKLKSDILDDYTKVNNITTKEGSDYDNIIPKPGGKVHGEWFYAGPKEVQKLDQYEKEYVRQLVTLRSGIRAYAFFLKPKARK